MSSLLLRGLARALLTVWVVTALGWTFSELAPGTSARRAAVASGALPVGDLDVSAEAEVAAVTAAAREHDLEGNPLIRIARSTAQATVFELGRSWQSGEHVRERIAAGSAQTLVLAALALLLATSLGLALAVWAVARRYRLVDHLGSALAAVLLAVPASWAGLWALQVFAYGQPFSLLPRGGLDSAGHAILPAIVLALAPVAVVYRHAYAQLCLHHDSDWAKAARARGIAGRRYWQGHLLRASLPELSALVPGVTAYLFAASVVVERIFAIDGTGELIGRAAERGDVPVLVGVAATWSVLISVLGTISDLVAMRLRGRS